MDRLDLLNQKGSAYLAQPIYIMTLVSRQNLCMLEPWEYLKEDFIIRGLVDQFILTDIDHPTC